MGRREVLKKRLERDVVERKSWRKEVMGVTPWS
jgi:hypothetical protein